MPRRLALCLPSVLLLSLAQVRPADACTTFMLSRGGEHVVGKSYDWFMGQGLVIVNKRGVAKQSLPAKPGDRAAQWVSRHASVTFNQYGREFPAGGMNDAGLVVEVMWLDSSEYERADRRPSLNELQWIQYQPVPLPASLRQPCLQARVAERLTHQPPDTCPHPASVVRGPFRDSVSMMRARWLCASPG